MTDSKGVVYQGKSVDDALGLSLQRAVAVVTVLGVAVMFAVGSWWQAHVHLNHDVGWIVRSAGWLLDGRRFGSDIVDSNPPLIWFLSIPAAMIARAGWFSEPEAIRLYVWLLCAGSLIFCHRLLEPLRRHGLQLESAAIILGAAFAMTIVPAQSFAQREFLAFVLGIPYCLLIAGRLAYGEPFARPLALMAGITGGVAFALKPWLLSVPFALEVLLLAKHRSWRSLLREETLALAGFLVAYAVAIVVLTPDYLTVSVPLAMAVYWAYGRVTPATMWPNLSDALEPLFGVALILAVGWSVPAYARVMLAAMAGYACNYWLQRKGFNYHLYPVIAMSIVLIVYVCVAGCRAVLTRQQPRKWIRWAVVPVIVLFGLTQLSDYTWQGLIWFERFNMETGAVGQPRQALIERLREVVGSGGKRVYAFSTHPYPAFPTLNYVPAESASTLVCQYAFSAHIKRDWPRYAPRRADIDRGVELQRQLVLREFLQQPPDIVLINTLTPRSSRKSGPFDFVGFFSSDPRFAALWREYRELEPVNEIRIFVREPRTGPSLTAQVGG